MERRDRTPQALEAEQSVLGAMMRSPDSYIQAGISSAEIFYSPRHRLIFESIKALAEYREPVDITTVSNELSRRGDLDKAGGRVYLVELVEGAFATSNIRAHARIIEGKYQARKIIEIARSAMEMGYDGTESPEQIASWVSQALLTASRSRTDRGFKRLGEYVTDVIETLQRIAEHNTPVGLQYGIPRLDELTGGAQKGELVVLAARPRMGKTALLNCIASWICQRGKKVGVFSVETGGKEYAFRSICTYSGLDSVQLKRGKIGEREMVKLVPAKELIPEWEYWVNDTPQIDIHTLCTEAARLKSEQDIDIIFIDYLQRLTVKMDAPRAEKVAYMVNQLKTLAAHLDIPIMLLSQLSRNCEMRQNKRPMLSDLAESSEIEKTADVVMFLYRHELYLSPTSKEREKYENRAELIIGKQRNGPEDKIDLAFYKHLTRFEQIEQEVNPF